MAAGDFATEAQLETLATKVAGDISSLEGASISSLNGATGVWVGTQTEYDAIGTKVATVLYFVTGA